MNATTNPVQMDKELREAERAFKAAKAAAEARRQAGAEAAAKLAAEADALAAEAARAEAEAAAVYAAERQAQAALDAVLRSREAARLDAGRQAAEQSEAGRTIMERARAELADFGDGRLDLRDQNDDELHLQAARVLYNVTGLRVAPELFVTVEPARLAQVTVLGTVWAVGFPGAGEAPILSVMDRDRGYRQVNCLAALVSLYDERSLPGLAESLAAMASRS